MKDATPSLQPSADSPTFLSDDRATQQAGSAGSTVSSRAQIHGFLLLNLLVSYLVLSKFIQPKMTASPRQLPYAPTPYSYLPNSSLTATINLDEEVKLSATAAERDIHDSLAEIYSIIITLDGLEKAYIRDSIPESEYTDLCSRLLNQYKSILKDETITRIFVDLETFKKEWDMECPRATERLRVNLPATIAEPSTTHAGNPSNNTSQSRSSATGSQILLATENFITFLDALRLNMLSKDSLHPLLSEVIQSVNQVTTIDFDNRGKIISWLIRLNGMKATEELGEEEARQLAFDMEGAYAGFKATLN